MPDLLAALIAFVAEHRRCGDLESSLEAGIVRIACSCGAEVVRPATPAADGRGAGPGPAGRIPTSD